MSGELAGTSRSALPCLAEVRVVDPAPSAAPVASSPGSWAEVPGRMAIELPSGVRVSVDASVDIDALGRVLAVLTR